MLKDQVRDSFDRVRMRHLKLQYQSAAGGELDFKSQYGDDILIIELLGDQGHGFYVEAGAYDGVQISNTYVLEKIGWKGLLVEPHPDNAGLCKGNRPLAIVENLALGAKGDSGHIEFTIAQRDDGDPLSFVGENPKHKDLCLELGCSLKTLKVPLTDLDSLLVKHGVERVDFLSLDVEGFELNVLKGFSLEKYQPSLLLIENQNDERDMHVQSYLNDQGYEEFAKRNINSFYCRKRDIQEFKTRCHKYESIAS